MGSRLISEVTIQTGVNDVLRVVEDAGGTPTNHDVTLTAGTYWHTDDDKVTAPADLIEELETRLISTLANAPWTVRIAGVAWSTTSTAEGRIEIAHTAGTGPSFDFKWSDPATTLDPRIFGWRATSADTVFPASTVAAFTSPDVHRYGWYAQQTAALEWVVPRLNASVEESPLRYLDPHVWGEYDEALLEWDWVLAPLVRPAAVLDPLATDMLLTEGDLNCAVARFLADLVVDSLAGGSRPFRYYADAAVTTTYLGDYQLPGDWDFARPLAESQRDQAEAAELYNPVVVRGRAVPS